MVYACMVLGLFILLPEFFSIVYIDFYRPPTMSEGRRGKAALAVLLVKAGSATVPRIENGNELLQHGMKIYLGLATCIPLYLGCDGGNTGLPGAIFRHS